MATMTLNKSERDRIVAEVRRESERCLHLMPEHKDLHGACLYLAAMTADKLRSMGARCLLQAGSATWLRIRPDQDDGVVMNRFGYEFDPEKAGPGFRDGMVCLPEMHCWAAIPDGPQLIDLTTGSQPLMCKRTTGADWPGDPPPDYLWATPKGVKAIGAMYTPHPAAIQAAFMFLVVSGEEGLAKRLIG